MTSAIQQTDQDQKAEKFQLRILWLLLLLLSFLMACVSGLFCRYLLAPAPLPEMMPLPVEVSYPPHYVFSIYGVDQPVGVAFSPRGDRIYVAETAGERLVKIFDRNGNLLGSFAPPRTTSAQRSPVYVAVDSAGKVYVTDRLQHAVFMYDANGNYLDTILSPNLTLSEYVSKHVAALQSEVKFTYNRFEANVHFREAGQQTLTFPAPDHEDWSPLGIRISPEDRLLLTDVATNGSAVRQFPVDIVRAVSWQTFDPPHQAFGNYGESQDEMLFPNAAVTDSRDRIFVSDGNNSRISVWSKDGQFLFNFGFGSGESALSLPRGIAIDSRDRLYVVDAVGQGVKTYDVSQAEPEYMFSFGKWGTGDGQFSYPNDIALDATGRLYIADRENNRVQVWAY
jgi:DNA-binding beta-propeller fold protein YncE